MDKKGYSGVEKFDLKEKRAASPSVLVPNNLPLLFLKRQFTAPIEFASGVMRSVVSHCATSSLYGVVTDPPIKLISFSTIQILTFGKS